MLKIIKCAIQSILLASIVIIGGIVAPQVHNGYLRWEVGESVVRVVAMDTKEHGGTGFAVLGKSGEHYIMTNKHVCGVQENGHIRVKVGSEKPVMRKVIYEDTEHDLCLIQGIETLAPLSIGSDQKKGEFLYAVGHPGLRDLTVSKGEYIGRTDIEMLEEVETRKQCSGKVYEAPLLYLLITGKDFICVKSFESLATTAVIYGGNSGSPVVNHYGNLIGVVFAGNRNQEHDNYIVPLSYVKKVLNKF